MTPLYLITPYSNLVRSSTRRRLFGEFAERIRGTPGVTLVVVELTHGSRPFEVTRPGNPLHVQLHSSEELWQKEAMLNVAIARLPHGAKYVAWVDADVAFSRPDWAAETVHQLQHYAVVQMFSHAQDLGPAYEPMQLHAGFVYNYRTHGLAVEWRGPCPDEVGNRAGGHPGYAWAARLDALDAIGGLLDYAVLGSADNHMAHAMVGLMEDTLYDGITPGYRDYLLRWQARCAEAARGLVGYVPGTILHYWHGKKSSRGYHWRWRILQECGFDPRVDLRRDTQGLLRLDPSRTELRDRIMGYMRSRNEDGTDV